jgi:hypothetical protein
VSVLLLDVALRQQFQHLGKIGAVVARSIEGIRVIWEDGTHDTLPGVMRVQIPWSVPPLLRPEVKA